MQNLVDRLIYQASATTTSHMLLRSRLQSAIGLHQVSLDGQGLANWPDLGAAVTSGASSVLPFP